MKPVVVIMETELNMLCVIVSQRVFELSGSAYTKIAMENPDSRRIPT